MRKRITRYALAFGLALSLFAAALPASAKPAGNPTPCYGATLPTKSIIMGGDIVYVDFKANAEGFQGNCDFWYTERLHTKYGSTMQVYFKIRVWALSGGSCGQFMGTSQGGWYSGNDLSFDSNTYYYGSCGKQADNYGTQIGINPVWYTIGYGGAGYQNFG